MSEFSNNFSGLKTTLMVVDYFKDFFFLELPNS